MTPVAEVTLTVLDTSIGLDFHKFQDRICRDISGVGGWGNGDVEVGLASKDQLPYVMGLVRQALEKQMGNGVET